MPNPLFDPRTGRLSDRGRLRSLGFRPTVRAPRSYANADGNKVTEEIHEVDGKPAGFSVEHPDGSRDQTVLMRSATSTPRTLGD